MYFQHKHPEIIIGKKAFDAQHPFYCEKDEGTQCL